MAALSAGCALVVVSLAALCGATLGQTFAACDESQLCVTLAVCQLSDDTGHNVLKKRSGHDCGAGKICCDSDQLERYDVRRTATVSFGGTSATTATTTSRTMMTTKPTPRTTEATTTRRGTTLKPNVPEPRSYDSCGDNKKCVPRHLCNGTINTSGKFLLKGRIGNDVANEGNSTKKECKSFFECCPHADQLTPEETPLKAILDNFKYEGCGHNDPDGLFYLSSEYKSDTALFGQNPWMVAVFTGRDIYLCGGTIIHRSLVLSSAHNFQNETIDTVVVRAGDWDLHTFNEPYQFQTRRLQQIIRHDKFRAHGLANDISLLVLTEPFDWQPHIQPICLPPPQTQEVLTKLINANCHATGWGLRNASSAKYEHILKRIQLPLVDRDECEGKLRLTELSHIFYLQPSFICAGGVGGSDLCTGDGGSPLVCIGYDNTNRYVLAGISSWGVDCGREDTPAVYANVPYLRSWIDRQAMQLGFSFDEL